MKNFCIFCGQKLVDGACACSDYKAYYAVAETPAAFADGSARSVIETPAPEVAPAVEIPDSGPTVYSGAASPAPAPAPTPAPEAAPASFSFTPAPEKKVEKASSDSHFKSAGDL